MKLESVGIASPGIGATGEGGVVVRGAHPESATTTALSVRACNSGGIPHDPQTRQRPIPALFAQAGSEDRQAAQPRHLRQPGGCREAREGSAVLQAALTPR